MGNSTEIPCVKCGLGVITCEWKTTSYDYSTEFGGEWDFIEWIDVTAKTCLCTLSKEERDVVVELAFTKMSREYHDRIVEITEFE